MEFFQRVGDEMAPLFASPFQARVIDVNRHQALWLLCKHFAHNLHNAVQLQVDIGCCRLGHRASTCTPGEWTVAPGPRGQHRSESLANLSHRAGAVQATRDKCAKAVRLPQRSATDCHACQPATNDRIASAAPREVGRGRATSGSPTGSLLRRLGPGAGITPGIPCSASRMGCLRLVLVGRVMRSAANPCRDCNQPEAFRDSPTPKPRPTPSPAAAPARPLRPADPAGTCTCAGCA